MAKKKDTITAKELDRRFDEGEDVSALLDWKTATRPGLAVPGKIANWNDHRTSSIPSSGISAEETVYEDREGRW